MNPIKLAACCFSLLLLMSSCKSKKEDDTVIPAEVLYQQGLDSLLLKKYPNAAESFGKIFFQHPGNAITPQAELMQAYSLFLDAKYDEAVDVLAAFIQLHPMNVDIAYAYYLKALSHYMQVSMVELDQTNTAEAKDAFEDVIRLFPNTKYATDARLKIDLVNDHLAAKDLYVGRFYLKKRNPIAAIHRFQSVVQNYQTTSHVPEALHRLVESNIMLGLLDEAKRYAAVLGHNYPESSWYKKSYDLISKSKQGNVE